MKHYAGQKAQQAMEELLKEAPLAERVKHAWAHLMIADKEHFVEDSADVARALNDVREAFKGEDVHEQAKAVGYAIEAIFEEYGATEAMKRMAD